MLAIIQARIHSMRLPKKMLLPIGGKPLIRWQWEYTCKAVRALTVLACPLSDRPTFVKVLGKRAAIFGYYGAEDDVLGRFHACAHHYKQHAEDGIIRITPDDFPVDITRERFTLAELDHWHATVTAPYPREHIGLLIPQRIEINTQEDYELARARVKKR
jgi:hypothetical protein